MDKHVYNHNFVKDRGMICVQLAFSIIFDAVIRLTCTIL